MRKAPARALFGIRDPGSGLKDNSSKLMPIQKNFKNWHKCAQNLQYNLSTWEHSLFYITVQLRTVM